MGGVKGSVLIGVLVWHDALSLWQVRGIILIVAGAMLLKAFTSTGA